MKTTARTQHRRPVGTVFVTLAPLFLAAGCTSVGTDFESPDASVPAAWRAGTETGFNPGSVETSAWWSQFGDPILDSLVERAVRYGPDVREGLARLRQARALRGIAAADQFPGLDGVAAYQRRSESERTPLGAAASDWSLYSSGLEASWELDLWGRVRRSVEAADADLAAEVEDLHAVALALAAETTGNYVELRAFQRRIAIARTNVRLQEDTLSLVRARVDAGLVGERDLAQAATNVEVTRSRVPELVTGWRAAENRLAVLVGVAPGELAAELELVHPIPVPPVEVAVGVPADLVRNRPDIRRAERLLAAEHARIGVATGDLYPRLALSGNVGVAADSASGLFHSGSETFGIGPSIRWNLFDGGRVRRRVEAQDARTEQAFVQWERTVLVALEETENAMTAFVQGQARREAILTAASQSRRAVELAQLEYEEGQADFQAVLDSQRGLAQLEDEQAQTEAAIATRFVALHKALGGG